jgi:hypothetical protein
MGFRLLSVSLCVLGLSACAGPIETRILSSGEGSGTPQTILREDLPQSAIAAQARQLAAQQLEERGYGQSDAGVLQLHVAFAERDASIAVRTKSSDAVRDIAAAKPKKPLQSCKDREMRLSVTLTRIADGAVLYRGSAAEFHCNAGAANVMPSLVDAALRDLDQPKGAYSVKRQGLE